MMKSLQVVLIIALTSSAIVGCSMRSVRTEFFGLSKTDITAAAEKQERIVMLGADACMQRILAFLSEINVTVTKQDMRQQFVVAIRFDRGGFSCIDTTAVGICVVPRSASESTMIVYSGNYRLAAAVADRLAAYLAAPAPVSAPVVSEHAQ